MELDRIDRMIVVALMTDATLPLARLADRVGLTQTPCWKRLQRLRDRGVIRGRVAVVDPESVGLGLTVFATVTPTEQSAAWHEDFAGVLSAVPEVMEAHLLADSHDYALRIVVRDMAGFERIRATITAAVPVRTFTANFSSRRVKAETVLPIDTRTI